MGNDRNRLQKLIEISIAKFNHFPFNSPAIEIDLEIDRGNSGKAEDRKLTETKRIPIYRQPVSVPDGEQLEIDHFDLPDDSVISIFVIMSSI